jgi:quinol monooxygenase YgiN
MIIRIVKMTFREEKVEDFLKIFDASKHLIRKSEGCNHLELLRDIDNPQTFFTYSFWKDQAALDAYRSSALFASVWAETKPLFSAKAEAWSLSQDVICD